MRYRKDIQILRGISVLLIVLFHLEIGGLKSGFLGVDVFFVITGFLMVISYDKNRKSDFFLKRAKRLLPAYYVTILFTLAATIFLTTPNEFNQAAEQSIFAVFFSSNIGYWLQNSYFSKAEFNPLLHLWAFGVEIQFYFLVPLLFWGFNKNKAVLPLCLVFSLTACFFIVGISPKTSFFMMPLRLWEFLIGYAVAVYLTDKGAVKNSVFSWLGVGSLIVIIGIPVMNVNGEALGFIHGHPGAYALVVSLATGIFLAFGTPQFVAGSKIGSLLEIGGKYSYSLYLVHFPVIVLFLFEPFSGTILKAGSLAQAFALIGIILSLTILMYHVVEAPIRFSGTTSRWLLGIPFLGLVMVFLFYFAGTIFQQFKFSEKEMLIFQAWSDRACYRCGKVIRVIEPTSISCETTHNIENPSQRILLVGDSHADSIKSTFSSVAESLNVSVRFMIENDPLIGGSNPETIINEALLRRIDTIILHYHSPYSIVPVIRKLVDLATKNGIHVAFIMPVPWWDRHIPKALWRKIRFNEALPLQSLKDYENANQDLYKGLLDFASDNFKVYSVVDIFCHEQCQITSSSGKPLYFDRQHLTLTGSELFRGLFYKIITDSSR